MMATKADKAKWDKLHADLEKAYAAKDDYEIQLGAKYGHHFQLPWLGSGERKKLEQLRARADKLRHQVLELIIKISPRGERWMSGAPMWWVARTLTWEDAIRPADEPLSVVVPGSYGNKDGTVTERRTPARVRSTRATENMNMSDLIPFTSWPEVLEYARSGGLLYYSAPMDRRPTPLRPSAGAQYRAPLTYAVGARTIRIWPLGSTGRGRNRTSDPFTADSGHLERFSRPEEGVAREGSHGRTRESGSRDRLRPTNDLESFKEFLDKHVMLVAGESSDHIDPYAEQVHVAIVFDVTSFGPHSAAIYVDQNRFHASADESMQEASELLEEWLEEKYPDADEHRTETFDARTWTLPALAFTEAIYGTEAEKFIDVLEPEEEEGDDEEGEPFDPGDIDKFTRAYFETAIWSSNDESDDSGGEPLDKNYDIEDFSEETGRKMIEDAADFQERYADLLADAPIDSERAGHNFWLSRNGHGAGFFDDNLDELQKAAEGYGEFNLYVDDDGQISGS